MTIFLVIICTLSIVVSIYHLACYQWKIHDLNYWIYILISTLGSIKIFSIYTVIVLSSFISLSIEVMLIIFLLYHLNNITKHLH